VVKEDLELINEVKDKSCDDSLNELINRHAPLCFDIYNKYSKTLKASGELIDNIELEKNYIIYKAALSFNPEKGTKFSTWLGNFTRYYCLNIINTKKKYVPMDNDILATMKEKDGEHQEKPVDQDLQDYVINILEKMKDERIKNVFKLRYFSDFNKKNTWVEIGKLMNVSPQTAINLHNRGRVMIAKKINSKLMADTV
tara:strand:- start:41755 stop:42348 length:594 start_codon:yes stop_codon:yes gene_type:complete